MSSPRANVLRCRGELPTGEASSMPEARARRCSGTLIGDGCTLPTHAIQYTTNDRGLADEVCQLAEEVFGDSVRPRVTHDTDKRRGRSWFQVFLASTARLTHGKQNPIARWLRGLDVFGLRSHEKRVPAKVFEQPASAIAIFLRHLWSTDGCVLLGSVGQRGRHNPRIYYATSSPQLAEDVQALLLRVGINARRPRFPSREAEPITTSSFPAAPTSDGSWSESADSGRRRSATRRRFSPGSTSTRPTRIAT